MIEKDRYVIYAGLNENLRKNRQRESNSIVNEELIWGITRIKEQVT